MTREKEKQLLLQDLCARLPYGVICDRLGQAKKLLSVSPYKVYCIELDNGEYMPGEYKIEDIKPYLHPMSSMTEEEAKCLFLLHFDYRKEYEILKVSINKDYIDFEIDDRCCSFERHTIWFEDAVDSIKSLDWLNTKHFDYRGLIEKGLALEAPEGMYNLKEK